MTRALILDCDGVLADTERDGHLVAFNETFDELGLPIHWSDEQYAALVRVGGGKERIYSVLTPERLAQIGIADDQQAIATAVAHWHRVKTEKYMEIVSSGRLPARPGVARLIEGALTAGWTVSIASTSAPSSVEAVLTHVVGADVAQRIRIFAGDVVAAKKPAPDIYLYACANLGVDTRDVVVIEDSGVGCSASTAAGLATIVSVSGYTSGDNFDGAALVVSHLGEVGIDSSVLANPWGIEVKTLVDQAILEQVRLESQARGATRTPEARPEPS